MTQKMTTIRVEKEVLAFIRQKALNMGISMNELINDCLKKYKIKCEKRLTSNDIMIS
jgi:predicted HicB family RNase H-like nuclease